MTSVNKGVLNVEYRQMLSKLGDELTRGMIQRLIFLYPQITRGMSDDIEYSRSPATSFFRKLEDKRCISDINVIDLMQKLQQLSLNKAAQILQMYMNLNANLINEEICRRADEAKFMNKVSSTPLSPAAIRNDAENGSKEVFISFSFLSFRYVQTIVERLESEGIGCWICTDEMEGGDNIDEKVAQAITDCKVFLCMIGKGFADSKECEKEVRLAKQLEKIIIPIHIEDVPWPLVKTDGSSSSMALAFSTAFYIRLQSDHTDEDYQAVIKAIQSKLERINEFDEEPGSSNPAPGGGNKRKCSTNEAGSSCISDGNGDSEDSMTKKARHE